MDKLKDILPTISIIALVAGALRQYMFYRMFGVDIASFLDFTEVLQLEYIFFFGVCLLFLALVLTFTRKLINVLFKLSTTNVNIIPNKEDYAILTERLAKVDTMPGSVHSKNRYKKLLTDRFAAYLEIRVNNFIVYMLAGAALIVATAYVQVYTVSHSSPDNKVSFEYAGKNITTSNDYFLIGRTKNYIFFYSKSKAEADVYSNSEIKHLTFKSCCKSPEALYN